MDLVVRPAVPTDAPTVAALHVGGWRAGYAGLLPAELLDGLDEAAYATRWRAELERGARALLAEEEGTAHGFVSFGRDDAAATVFALYVARNRWRRGLGSALLTEAVRILRRDGADAVVLWVLTDNARARAFYEAEGWVADGGARTERRRNVELPEVRYRWGGAAPPRCV